MTKLRTNIQVDKFGIPLSLPLDCKIGQVHMQLDRFSATREYDASEKWHLGSGPWSVHKSESANYTHIPRHYVDGGINARFRR